MQAGTLRGKSLCGSKRAEVFLGDLWGFCCVVHLACMQNKAPELDSDPNATESSHTFLDFSRLWTRVSFSLSSPDQLLVLVGSVCFTCISGGMHLIQEVMCF